MAQIEGRIVLASASPRRKQIMEEQLGFKNVDVVPSRFPENLSHDDYAPFEYPIQTATQKALDVYKSEADADESPALLIAADTVVELNGIIMEKPRDINHHVDMLKQLRDSNKPHHVYTGIAAIIPFEKPVLPGYALETALGISEVTFRSDITDQEIIDYVASGEASDAAGGYKIQDKGGALIKTVTGDRFNVIGLPVEETKNLIAKTLSEAKDEDDDDDYEDMPNGEEDSDGVAYY